MKPLKLHHGRRASESGQTMFMFILLLTTVILFVGLAIDFGLAYMTKSNLAKAVDSAALMGARNLFQGDDVARNIVQSTFAMNYGRPGRDTAQVVPTISITTDANTGQRRLQVTATSTFNTFFIRIIPVWQTLSASATAEAVRGRLIMSIILDRSGSMANNGGWSSLPPAMDTFINLFDDSLDKLALITFASAARVDFPSAPALGCSQPFKTQIQALVPRQQSQYAGATFMEGGLTNGYARILNTPVISGDNPVKVAVLFTDGLANVIQERVQCETTDNPRTNTWNFGGFDSGSSYGVFYPTTGSEKVSSSYGSPPTSCDNPGLRQFNKVSGGVQTIVNMTTIHTEAQQRMLALAENMQAAGIIVYTIGFGSDVDATFLREVANDRASDTYNPGLPSGKAVIAPTTSDIVNSFNIIAADVLSRLTR